MRYSVETIVDAFPMVPAADMPVMESTVAEFLPEIPWKDGKVIQRSARFLANRKALVKRLKAVSAFTPRRGYAPILQTVRVSVNGTVELAATNQEMVIVTDDDFAREGDVSGLVSPARILAVLKGMKTPDVECELTSEKLTIKSDNAALSVPVEEFFSDEWTDKADGTRERRPQVRQELPIMERPTADVVFIVSAAELAHGISQTIYSVDTESTRYALSGVLFELCDDGELNLVATDTRRLAVSNVGRVDVLAGESTEKDTFVIPAGFLAALKPFIAEAETVKVTIGRTSHSVEFCATGWRAVSRLVEGRFPRYRDVIPAKSYMAVELAFDRDDLLAALETASVASSEESRGLDFVIPAEAGGVFVEITGKSVGAGESTARVHAGQVVTGKPVTCITFDPRYIVEYLRALPKSANYVQLALADECSAGLLTATGERGSYVIMPLSRDR